MLIFSSGGALWLWAAWSLLHGTVAWSSALAWDLAGLSALTFASLFRYVRLSQDTYHSVYTLDDVPLYALIFLQGWHSAAWTAGLCRGVFELVRLSRALYRHPERVHWSHVIYHFSDVPMSVNVAAAAGATYMAVAGGEALLGGVRSGLAVAAASLVWFVLAFGQNAIALTLRRGLGLARVGRVIRGNLRHIRLQVLMLVPLGALLAMFMQELPWAALLLLVPISLLHNALEAQHKLRSESVNTIEAVARYLEERDPYTQGHSTRVAGYGVAIAQQLGMDEDGLEQVRRAGLIHDIGKVDIPDAILRKPGQLNAVERQIMDTHTDRAVELGRLLVSLGRELPFEQAAYHHENYDGSGQYGMAGEQIPLISRILAVADTYDAMTSDRPYRQKLDQEEALRRLRQAAGTQLDARCVEAFGRAVEEGAI